MIGKALRAGKQMETASAVRDVRGERLSMTVSEQLREAIIESGLTHYRIGKDTGVDTKVIDRFVSGERPTIRSDTLDRLCEYLGLQLRAAKGKRPTG